ncbi:hypothetical protein [Brevundimonas sp.]|uniref:hypothetical protein n=1 Tax=Brevundimonas sp. TaxID=1871086 RepID=UPI002D754307|nr:hypothetical protein [Brevundimonas sp.]HYC68896.1 hypothetical protein [Brevundimonas sp.]
MANNDVYAPQLTALMRGTPGRAKSAAERAAFIVNLVDGWDRDGLGDWRDAVAVAARRQKVHSRSSTVLLAKILWGVDSKRAAEIGRIAEKFRTRDGSQLIKDVESYGGVKKVSRSDFKPPKRPRIRRAPST